jgi:hypothetical protein
MAVKALSAEEIGSRARDLYEGSIRQQVERGNHGRYIMIDVVTGEYRIGDDLLEMGQKARQEKPDAVLCSLKIGVGPTGTLA